MSYTYPQALNALQDIARDFVKAFRPGDRRAVNVITDLAPTASVIWNAHEIAIHLPVRPATATMTETEFQDWVSYMLHEIGHPMFTDWATWESACRAGLGKLTNALEDVRMERAVIKSGVALNAKAVLSRLVSRKVAEARAGNWRPNSRKEIGWTLCVLGRAANGYDIDAGDLAWISAQIAAGGTVETVLGWALPELATCKSTADCVALARKISAAIAVPAPKGQPSPQQARGEASEGEGQKGPGEPSNAPSKPGEASDTPSDGEGEGEGEGEGSDGTGEASSERQGEGEGEGEESEAKPGKGGKPGDNQGGGKGEKDGTPGNYDANDETPVSGDDDLSERELTPKVDDTLTGSKAANAQRVTDVLRHDINRSRALGQTLPGNTRAASTTRMRDLAAHASRQRALLARTLRANETDDREGGRRTGRLDRGALTRAAAGAPNVFARREISEGFDTDVAILIDASSSMRGANIRAALETGLVVAQAAGSVGAACTVEVFSSRGFFAIGKPNARRAPDANEFAQGIDLVGGCTPLSPHLSRIAQTQAKRAPHKRRVVFVITDGDCDYGHNTVGGVADYLEQTHGTVFAHVSIENAVHGVFKAEVCIPQGKNVTDIGLDHFVKVLAGL